MCVFVSCKSGAYRSESFDRITRKHKLIAVLPAEVKLEGKQPAKLSEEQIKRLEEGESIAFQKLMQSAIRSEGKQASQLRVAILDADEVNRRMTRAGIDIRQSWNYETKLLCELLGVDAIVRISIVKTRYLPNLASYGIDLGTDILGILKTTYSILHPATRKIVVPSDEETGLTRTQLILLNTKVLEHSTGHVLWENTQTENADRKHPTERRLEQMIQLAAEAIPYRKQKK
jgi:hypothetical protein